MNPERFQKINEVKSLLQSAIEQLNSLKSDEEEQQGELDEDNQDDYDVMAGNIEALERAVNDIEDALDELGGI
jgi:prefoldin subunit 5